MYGLTEIVMMNSLPIRFGDAEMTPRRMTDPEMLRLSGRQSVELAKLTETRIEDVFDNPLFGFVNKPFTDGEWQERNNQKEGN